MGKSIHLIFCPVPVAAVSHRFGSRRDLVDAFGDWVSDASMRRKIMVDTSAAFYRFALAGPPPVPKAA